MKRIVLLLTLFLLMCIPASAAQPGKDFDGTVAWPIFRDTQWSMSQEMVLLLESERGVQMTEREVGSDEVTCYAEITIDGIPATLVYCFYKDKLLYGEYFFETDNRDQLISIFKEQLIEQYGEPFYDSLADATGSQKCYWQNDWEDAVGKPYYLQTNIGLFIPDNEKAIGENLFIHVGAKIRKNNS